MALHLPSEICSMICEHLDRPSLKQVHLVSRRFASAAEPGLFDTFFLRCDLDRFEKFYQISRHERIRRLVKKLHYQTRMYYECSFAFWISLSFAKKLSPSELKSRHVEYQDYAKEQRVLGSFDTQAGRIADAIRELPSLTSVCLDNSVIDVSRGPPCIKHVHPACIQTLQPRSVAREHAKEVFSAFSAAMEIGIPNSIEELSLAGQGLQFIHDEDTPRVAPPVQWNCLNRLKSLEIDMHQYRSNLLHQDCCSLTKLLQRTRDLKKLNIFFGPFSTSSYHSRDCLLALQPTAYTAFIDRLLPPPTLPEWTNLAHLRLGELTVSSERFLSILQDLSNTLSSLELFNIGLTKKWTGSHDMMAGLTTHSWIYIINFLARMSHLTHVEFEGFLTNHQTESWRVARDNPRTTGSAEQARTPVLKERIKRFILHGEPSPFERKTWPAGNIDQWTQDEIDSFSNSRGQKYSDGGRRFLPWDFEDDDSWRYDCDAWEFYNYSYSLTI